MRALDWRVTMLTDPQLTDMDVSVAALKVLQSDDITLIEAAINKIGSSGEVHLLIERGRLRYIRTLKRESMSELPPPPSS